MKTNFALGLTQDGITLWQRDGSGWLRVGAVALDTPDMDAAMSVLVDKARKLAPEGVATKLVIPDEHLLMTSVHAPGPGRDAQEVQIRAALAGRTPFPVEELVFDWSGAGTTVAVAVVARETLIEAEDFASAQGLNPVAFVAAAAPDGFRGEPFLGLTRAMRAKRVNPADVPRDGMVLRETGVARLPEPPAPPKVAVPDATVPAVPPAPKAPANSATVTDTPPVSAVPVSVPAAPAPVPPAPAAAKTASPDRSSDAAPKDQAQASKAPEPAVVPPAAAKPLAPAPADKSRPAATSDVVPAIGTPKLPPVPAPATTAPTVPVILNAPAAMAADAPSDGDAMNSFGFRTRRQGQTAAALPRPPAPPVALTTSRAPATATAWKSDTETALTDGAAKDSKASKGNIGGTAFARLADSMRARYSQTNATVTTQVSALRAALAGRKDAISASAPVKTLPAPSDKAVSEKAATEKPQAPERSSLLSALAKRQEKPAKAAASTADASRSTPLETLRKIQATPRPLPSAPAGATSADEAQRLTVFGARGGTTDVGPPPLPRKALLLTGGFLLVLISAAIWALYFMAADPEQTQAPTITTPDVAAPAPLAEVTTGSQDQTDLAAIEAALGQSDAAQGERLAEDGSDTGADSLAAAPADMQTGALSDDASADTLQAPPRETDAGRVAEIRSNGIVVPQDQSGALSVPSPPAPFGADPLPPLRGSPEALALQAPTAPAQGTIPVPDAPVPDAPVVTEVPAGPVLPAGEEALTIGVTEGPPPSVPPAKPARLTQPETPPAPAPPAQDAPEQDATAPAAPLTEADLDIRVTQGTPAAVPPRRPGSVAAPADTPPSEANVIVAPDIAPQQQGSLVPATPGTGAGTGASTGIDTGTLAPDASTDTDLAALPTAPPPPGGVALSALRPAARPSDLRRAPEAVVAQEPVFPNATEQAVESSVRPSGRPAQFAEVVQRTLRATTPRETSAPPAAVEAIQTASAAVAMPALPTATSVAREATVSRAINLREVNLLGVMGTSSSRRALVRLSNGRVVTVRVGESLDGGQVTAIGDSELRYVRRGRDVVLRIAS